MQQAIKGEDTNIAAEALGKAQQYLPGTSLWYARLAFERMMINQMQDMADPNASKRFKRQIKTRKKDHKQEYWWPPGKATPSKAPELDKAISF